MASSETSYSFRNRVPLTLERGRTQTSSMSAYRAGALVLITSGEYSLLAPGGSVVVNAAAATISGGVASYDVNGTTHIPSTAQLGLGWQERWVLSMPDGTTRTVRRTVALARFELHPPLDDAAITREYPDILDSLGNYADNLSNWVDAAWEHVVRVLHRHGSFPHVLVEPSDVYEWAFEEACYRIYRALYRSAEGDDERWRTLMEMHERRAGEARQATAITPDRDQDGIADTDGKQSATASAMHWNLPHTSEPTHLPKKFR